MHNSVISCVLGQRWRRMSLAERQPFIAEAERVRTRHMIDNPDYRYRPQRKNKRRASQPPAPVPVSYQQPRLTAGPSGVLVQRQFCTAPHASPPAIAVRRSVSMNATTTTSGMTSLYFSTPLCIVFTCVMSIGLKQIFVVFYSIPHSLKAAGFKICFEKWL